MRYIEIADAYVCANDRIMWPVGIHHKKSASGYHAKLTVFECEDYSCCSYKEKCTKAQGNRRMELSRLFIDRRHKSHENITSEKGIHLRIYRSIQVEVAFGVLKGDYELSRYIHVAKIK